VADSDLTTVPWRRQLVRQAILIVASCATLYPVLWVVRIALSPDASLGTGFSPIPTELTLDHFRTLLGHRDATGQLTFPIQLANSLVVSLATTLVGVAVSVTAAYAFSRFSFPGREAGMKAFLVTQMFPGVVMAIPLYILLDELHLLNSMLGLTLVYSTTSVPFSVWMLKGYFDTIPADLEEAALVDGASRWFILTRVVLPLAVPAIVITALFSFMTAWNEFILAATFLNGERNVTLPVLLQGFVDENNTDWGPFAAGAIVVSLPVMLLFFVLQRHLVGGLTAGGVKG
jgi:arabinogalactan oligomer/maltooligosaccharide transport system permease protein